MSFECSLSRLHVYEKLQVTNDVTSQLKSVYIYINIHIPFLAPKPECVTDPECPQHLACIGQKCRDPCVPEQCAPTATCRVNNHRALCVCPPGLEGDPYRACVLRKSMFIFFIKIGFIQRLGDYQYYILSTLPQHHNKISVKIGT